MSAVLAAAETPSQHICAALRERYGPLKHAEKLLARRAGTTPRTAENWLSGECGPRIDALVTLMAADPEIEAVVVGLVRLRRAEKREG